MHLPDGYVAERHWSWSRTSASMRLQPQSAAAWEDLDDTYLFPITPPQSLSRGQSRHGSIVGMSLEKYGFSERATIPGSSPIAQEETQVEIGCGWESSRSSGAARMPIRAGGQTQEGRRQRNSDPPTQRRSTYLTDARADQRYEGQCAVLDPRVGLVSSLPSEKKQVSVRRAGSGGRDRGRSTIHEDTV
jgi:hypothetical protein